MTRASGGGGAGAQARQPAAGQGVTPLSPEDFRSATEFLAAEHRRQRGLCDLLERVSHNPRHGIAELELEALREYLEHGFDLHMRDEEEDFLPVVEQRAAPQENMRELRAQLAHEHAVDLKIARALAAEIVNLTRHRAFQDPASFLANAWRLAEAHRRHIAWEDSVVLPRARHCLKASDHRQMLESMAARRRA